MKCPYCSKEYETNLALGVHKVRCKLNPNRKEWSSWRQTSSWNKGLTKETDERIKRASERFHERFEKGEIKVKGHPHTQETKDKLSKARVEYLDSCRAGFQDVGWYRIKNICGEQYVVRGTWQRDFGVYLNGCGIEWKRKICLKYRKSDGSIHRYVPDFYIPSIDEYVQVKGYFSDRDKEKLTLVLRQSEIKLRWVDSSVREKIKKGLIGSYYQIPYYSS